jgi:hypothetical protein
MEFHKYFSNYKIIKKDYAPWNLLTQGTAYLISRRDLLFLNEEGFSST